MIHSLKVGDEGVVVCSSNIIMTTEMSEFLETSFKNAHLDWTYFHQTGLQSIPEALDRTVVQHFLHRFQKWQPEAPEATNKLPKSRKRQIPIFHNFRFSKFFTKWAYRARQKLSMAESDAGALGDSENDHQRPQKNKQCTIIAKSENPNFRKPKKNASKSPEISRGRRQRRQPINMKIV